jgi:GAF domain-containing protein
MAQDQHMLELFYRVAHTINGSLDLDTTLQAILQAVRDALKVDLVTVRLLSPDANALEPVASIGVSMADLAALPDEIGPGSIHERVMAGETVHIHGTSLAAAGLPPTSGGLLSVPLQVRDRAIGSLTVYCADQCELDADTLTLLRGIADMAAVAIENARLHTSLVRIAQAMTSSLELQPMLSQVLSATVLEMGLKAASIRLVDSSGKHLELVAAHGLSERYLSKGPVQVSQSPLDRRLLAGESVTIYDVTEDPAFQYPAEARVEGIRSVLAVPLQVKDRIVGVMRVYSSRPRPFTPVGTAFLQSVAGMVAVAIENAKLYEALQARYEVLKSDVSEWYRFLSLG